MKVKGTKQEYVNYLTFLALASRDNGYDPGWLASLRPDATGLAIAAHELGHLSHEHAPYGVSFWNFATDAEINAAPPRGKGKKRKRGSKNTK